MVRHVLAFAIATTATQAFQLRDAAVGSKSQDGASTDFPGLPWHGWFKGHDSNEHTEDSDEAEAFVQRLQNAHDVAYYGDMTVGGQRLKVIVDTGSFELLVFGKKCIKCGGKHLYNDDKSASANVSASSKAIHTFGSGTTYSVLASDSVLLAKGVEVPAQAFWEVVDAEMRILSDGEFQAILGVGPPASAVEFARMDRDRAKEELRQLQKRGDHDLVRKYEEAVQQYDDMVRIMSKNSGVIKNLGVQTMSTCLGQQTGSGGYHIWHDTAVRDSPEKFLTLDVVGDQYWSLSLAAVRLAKASVPEGVDQKEKNKLSKPISLGCQHGQCSAIVDSGTSLIAAPKSVVDAINDLADEWQIAGGTCEDLSNLPELRFKLNGRDFSLPPESYMGFISGDTYEELEEFMPRYHEKNQLLMEHKRRGLLQSNESKEMCEPLIMKMDDDESDFGQMWILGMPFLRKYYTSFHFEHGDHFPKAAAMSFSVADGDCKPGVAPHGKANDKLAATERLLRPAQMRIDASKIRVPSVAKKFHLHRFKR